MKTVIINYGSGNLRSVEKGVLFASQSLDMEVKVTACSDEVRSADRIILPGVGSFGHILEPGRPRSSTVHRGQLVARAAGHQHHRATLGHTAGAELI